MAIMDDAAIEYLNSVREPYRNTNSRKEKTRFLDGYCSRTGRSRKYAIRLLGSNPREKKPREATYNADVIWALIEVWELLGRPCGQRLKPLLDQGVTNLLRLTGELKISDEVAQKLVQISSATIDRKLKAERAKLQEDQRETPVRGITPIQRFRRQPVGQKSCAYEVPVAVPS